MATTPIEGLIRIVDLFKDGDLCPHDLDRVIETAMKQEELSSRLFGRMVALTDESEMFRIGMEAHMHMLRQMHDDDSKQTLIEGAMAMGLLFGMMLVFEACDLEEVTLASLVS